MSRAGTGRRPKKPPLCFWCQDRRAVTKDHVIPKAWFSKPRPSNLPTVGSCLECNQGFKSDEDLVRVYLVQHERANAEAQRLLEGVLRGMARPAQRGLLVRIARSFQKVERRSPSGLYLGPATAMRVETDRIERVMEKIVRGLYAHHFGDRLPDSTPVSINDITEITGGHSKIWSQMNPGGFGDTIRYRFGRLDDRPTTSAWYLNFYAGVLLMCSTDAEDLIQ